jgi:hypothetical protein
MRFVHHLILERNGVLCSNPTPATKPLSTIYGILAFEQTPKSLNHKNRRSGARCNRLERI